MCDTYNCCRCIHRRQCLFSGPLCPDGEDEDEEDPHPLLLTLNQSGGVNLFNVLKYQPIDFEDEKIKNFINIINNSNINEQQELLSTEEGIVNELEPLISKFVENEIKDLEITQHNFVRIIFSFSIAAPLEYIILTNNILRQSYNNLNSKITISFEKVLKDLNNIFTIDQKAFEIFIFYFFMSIIRNQFINQLKEKNNLLEQDDPPFPLSSLN